MIVAIASGKGGTGKTTVAVNLALSLHDPICGELAAAPQLLDCDVEEPNCHIFLKPQFTTRKSVSIPVPKVDEDRCTKCGECGKICQYSAIVSLKTKPLVFPEMCHGCGGCALVCPEEAISEAGREIGVIEQGSVNGCEFVHGRLRIGEAMSPPLIRAVKKMAKKDGWVIIDAPPGTSCPVIEAVKGSDYVILVTEPTPFGLNDLRLAVEMVKALSIPFGVVINRSGIGDTSVKEFCIEQDIAILAQIPNDRRIAEAYSRGETMIQALPDYTGLFRGLLAQIEGIAANG
jgi:MinD superfamily P-loop ATPase